MALCSKWVAFCGLALLSASVACCDVLPPLDAQRLARGIFQELVEINTTDSAGSTTVAAQAMAARLQAAGLAPEDIQVLAPASASQRGNLVARFRGTGEEKPIL